MTSLLWAAALATLLDGRLRRSAAYFLVAGACALVGIIHSPLADAVLGWPEQVIAQAKIGERAELYCQSPYHWTAAYVLVALLLVLLSFFRTDNPSYSSVKEETGNTYLE